MRAKRFLSILLSAVMMITAFPVMAFADSTPDIYTISNGYIKAEVSTKNGGFCIGTQEGNQLKKSDNNKRLLYHDDAYDTSFISFRISDGTTTEDYIFGGKYGPSTDPSRKGVTVTQVGGENTDIKAVWGMGDLEFTLIYGLANKSSNEHGMVSIAMSVKNKGTKNYDIKARILYDTALDAQDYGYYQLSDGTTTYTYSTEQLLDSVGAGSLPQNFFASDSVTSPSVVAYIANGSGASPFQVAFGHWNNLAATLYDFTPNTSFDFSSDVNDYYTADSALALYYNLGSAAAGKELTMTTFYGVFANSNVTIEERVSINTTAPTRLELNAGKTGYMSAGPGLSNMQVDVTFENYDQEGAKDLEVIAMAVTTTSNLRCLDTDTGQPLTGTEFDTTDPIIINYSNVKIGDIKNKKLNFQAKLTDSAAYEKITIGIYDVSETGGQLSETYLIGEKTLYVLLPASNGSLPKVGFVSMAPNTIFNAGTRHMYVSLTNSALLDDRSRWNLYAVNAATGTKVLIDNSGISITDNVMDVALGDETKLAVGSWQLQLEWSSQAVSDKIVESKFKEQTASCLMFTVSDEEKYKNECYGVIAIVRFGSGSHNVYKIKNFVDEAAYDEYAKNAKTTAYPEDPGTYSQILLTFKGDFTVEKKHTDGQGYVWPVKVKAVSKKSTNTQTRKTEVTNCVTINDCLDFENGTMSIYYDNDQLISTLDSIKVEFDGDLLTSGARTSVWSGQAGFSEIEQGPLYSLIKYDEDGERDDAYSGESIYLVWPTMAGIGQTICGMIFNLAFGEMGYIENEDGEEEGRVISFSANLDLSFTGTDTSGASDNQQTYWNKLKGFWKTWREGLCVFDYMDNSDYYDQLADLSNIDESTDNDKTISGSVMVQDILFGCGKGFYGLHFKVGVGIANYIEKMPGIKGELEVNTIGNWSFGLEGEMKLATFEMEAKLSFKSHNDIPIPDEIYFYIGGFEPGINIDGFGIVWITGGGGGIEDLYDTVMCTQKVPPIKLIVTLSFSIIQILDGKATGKIGPTGLSLEATDLKILDTIEFIERIGLDIEWWPGIDAKASMNVDLYAGLIKGVGYIVLIGEDYKDWFFEFFIRATLNIPESIPLVGGMSVAGVDLGASTEKIWGALDIMDISLGITYFWGEDGVDFGKGSKASPTYPDLLGYSDVPVYYDEERDDTLYMRVGTNLTAVCEASVVSGNEMHMLAALDMPYVASNTDMDDSVSHLNLKSAGLLAAYPTPPYARSNSSRTQHEFALGSYATKAGLVEFTYDASSLADAKSKAQGFTIKEQGNPSNKYVPTYYNGSNTSTANANVTYDSESGKATLSLVASSASTLWSKVWDVTTGTSSSNIALYNVNMLPELTNVSFTGASVNAGSDLTVNWSGSNLPDLDSMQFFLCETKDATDPGTKLNIKTDPFSCSAGTAEVTVPAKLKSGSYYLKCVYVEDNSLNGVIFSSGKVSVSNSNDPGSMDLSSAKAGGDLKLAATATVGANTDGVRVSVLKADGSATDITNMKFDAENGKAEILVGGSYSYGGKVAGLTAGESYKLSVTPYNDIDSDGDGSNDASIYGNTLTSNSVVLPVPKTPEISVSAAQSFKSLSYQSSSGSYNRDTYTVSNIDFTAVVSNYSSQSDVVSGSWSLDSAAEGSNCGTFTSQQVVSVPLKGITDGEHTLKFTGTNANGDAFVSSYLFNVDTEAPKLVLSSPLNGDFYKDSGAVTVEMLTDADAQIDISFDGVRVKSGKASSIGKYDNGLLRVDVSVPDPSGAMCRTLLIRASDNAGNYTERSCDVYNGALADIKSLNILVDGNIVSSGNIRVSETSSANHKLELVGITSSNNRFVLNDLPSVRWNLTSVTGNASIDGTGKMQISAGSQGIVSGGIEITTGSYLTHTLTYGASTGGQIVEIQSSIGGNVSGAGVYNAGDRVTVTATPLDGYEFVGWSAEGITLSNPKNATQTFIMPDGKDVILTATFRAKNHIEHTDSVRRSFIETSMVLSIADLPSGADPYTYVPCITAADGSQTVLPFSKVINGKLVYLSFGGDVSFVQKSAALKDVSGVWCEDAVNFAVARGIVSGYADGTVRQGNSLTRAMVVAILYRLSGSPASSGSGSYKDVASGYWYSDAIAWASENGIISGYANGKFGPNDNITREQLCAILVRYASCEGLDFADKKDSSSFRDQSKIASYAKESVDACQRAGIVSGKQDGSFDPKGTATRGQFCTMIMNFIDSVLTAQMQ